MKKEVIKGKKPRLKPRSKPIPTKHKDKKRKKVERLKEYDGINPFLR